MISYDVADGIHLITRAHVNCYVVEDENGVLLVDAGLPRMWQEVLEVLRTRGRRPGDIRALALTHGHFDHMGFARHAHREHGIPVLVHQEDAPLASHPYRYATERNRFLYPFTHPRSLPVLGKLATSGALRVRGLRDTQPMTEGSLEDLPGSPSVLHTPGHTDGHCILHLPERNTVISGDALVTLDPYTGTQGPQIVASAATKDTRQALDSLQAISSTGAATVLTGHGAPWTHGAEAAVEQARRTGAH
ncbi:MBL fold metallo-hydrolase [Nesterenkonia flava]|uniref:MBL fold metallo-hydrolase n=1 Tax=Nesterenkonia flava TaxID=469799 RepID=A0ABU1FSU6_9MICC|nr:MBL fold metallo-hydrolase [Nesterenkonia flava]MDR5711735.1 MBL fold metallo-hydrolase [Nesterenkonia flava]